MDVDDAPPTVRGRPLRVEEKNPTILKVLSEILKDLGNQHAHKRRRDDVCHIGISAPALQTALDKKNVVSTTAIRELFLPPHANTDNAKRYTSLLHYRMYSPQQDNHAYHQDAHFTSAQVRIIVEMAADSE